MADVVAETLPFTQQRTDPGSWETAHWEPLQRLFHLAASAPEDERARVLAEACPDTILARRVMDLLETPADPAAGSAWGSERAELGTRVGPYTLLRHLGSGGLGSVYLVERTLGGVAQPCALKVLALHAAGPEFQTRFQREQQIVASLSHPNITRCLDAGFTDAAQPFLLMEYVDGAHLTAHCDERRLDIPQRLALFLQICDAVSYAHRHLVVHLDLKPSNILVSTEGHVKLVDFGTSKLLDPDSSLTTTVLATPAYAAPEQLRNEPVTTACDVYSLGVVLFELLCGQRPFPSGSVAMMVYRAHQELEPPRLTTAVTAEAAELRGASLHRLQQALRGDLATVVARCLNSRPADRYANVDALAVDVRRFLQSQPILARKQTLGYQLARFARRHRAAVVTGALAACMVIGSLVFAAVRQQQSLRNAERAVQMQTFMTQLFKLANTNYMGKPAATVPEFLALGVKVIPGAIHAPGDQRAGTLSLAESMYSNSDYAEAEPVFARVIEDAKRAGDIPIEAEAEAYAGMTAYKLGKLEQASTLAGSALGLAHRSGVSPAARIWIESFYIIPRYERDLLTDDDVRLERAAVAEARKATVPENELAFALQALAETLEKKGTVAEQQALADEALRIYQREPYAICETAGIEEELGVLRQQTNDLQGSVDALRASYLGYKQCSGPDSSDALETAGYLALAMVPAKQTREAIPLLEDTLPRLERKVGADSLTLKAPLLALARCYLAEGQFAQSEATAARLFHVVDGKINPLSIQMGAYQSVWARALAGEGRTRDALAHAQLAEQSYNGGNAGLPASKDNAALTHKLVLDLQAKVAAGH